MDQYRYEYVCFDRETLSSGSVVLPEDYCFADYITAGAECCAVYDETDDRYYLLDLDGNRTGEYADITSIEKL